MKVDISDYPEFSEAIKNKSLVYLFGTGISSALTGKAFSWKKWVVDGITYMHNRALAEQYSTMLQSETSADILIYVVGNVISETKNDGTYSQWMSDSFEVNPITDTALTETLKKMLLTQDVFVTTNYDTLLEQATGLETLSYESPNRAFDMLDKKKNSAVLHIHGVYDSKECIDNIIASQEQYDQILNNEGAQFIQHILGTRTLVFIGCGQTTDDVNISRFIEFAKRYLNMDQKYFFLCKNDSVPNDMPDNIIIVPYGDNYSDLPEFLENMIQIRLRTLVEKNPIIGRTSFEPENDFSDSLLQYHYSQQKIPFCGRKNELYELDKFIVDDNKFQWWAITGQAGSGKSRLALELIRRLPSTWFGFFIDDKSSQCDVQNFVPFSDTLVVIDYVSGRESIVADYMRLLSETFEKFSYNLRILLIERDNCKKVGSWYAKLKQRFGKYDVLAEAEYQEEFLNIVDLDDESVESFIGSVCLSKGLSPDSKRDMSLRVAYGKKFEKLRFRPLYVQIFVEAWIDNGGELPRYDSFDDLLGYTLKREQERWLLGLDGDQVCCNAVIRLLLRANISGSLDVAKLPGYYKKDWDIVHGFINTHSFPGEQRSEMQNSIINAICQNIDTNNCEIAPLFPDIIKEYMFFFYADVEKLQEVLQELWENAAHEFSVFITRCLTDFPNNDFFRRALNTYETNTANENVLLGRLELLKKTTINEDDDPYTLIDIIYNEYDFWKSIVVPTDDAEKAEHISTLKFVGLDMVATRLGGWSMYDMTPMIEVIEEALKVRGSEGLEKVKQIALNRHVTALAETSFLDEASYLKEKLESYISEESLDEFSNLMHMCNRNVEMMDCIMSEIDFKKAVKVLKQMDSECLYSCIDSARTMAHSCFNIDVLAFQLEKYSYIGVGYTIIRKIELLYPDDWNIRSRVLGCHTVQLQKKLFVESNISNAEFKIGVEELEEKLDTMKFGQESSDEALGMAWGMIKILKLKAIGEDEKAIMELIMEADRIICDHPGIDAVVETRIKALHALHIDARKDKVSHEEVEKVFGYVEQCSDSNSVREAFFEMLKDSEVAGNRDNYLTKKVVQGAIQGARYDPLVGSGIPEFDMAAEIQRMDQLAATNNLPYRRTHKKVGANDPCPCGSGKKFKKCCRGNGKYD